MELNLTIAKEILKIACNPYANSDAEVTYEICDNTEEAVRTLIEWDDDSYSDFVKEVRRGRIHKTMHDWILEQYSSKMEEIYPDSLVIVAFGDDCAISKDTKSYLKDNRIKSFSTAIENILKKYKIYAGDKQLKDIDSVYDTIYKELKIEE